MSASVQTADEAPASETVTLRGRTALRALLPDRVTGSTRLLAWCTLAVHIGIVVTGGLVRLTGSGLGCPTWPSCTEDSFVPTPEMGVHGVIEFGNRTLTGVLCVVALLTLLAVLRTRGGGRRLLGPAVWIGVLTLVQAVVGGVTVLVDLHPGAVGIHMLISMGLVSIASVLLVRVLRDEPAPRRPLRRALREHRAAAIAAVLVWTWTWITVFVGALTTGSGPHAGDAAAARNGLPPELMQHLHSYPAYVLLGCTLLLIVA
ncbi:MAG: COX15/CtaA family protein, partial [Pseudoclavibacter sp.]|nr:COX15/CtaA family protein [Pseudoclavibacter sp.]